MGKKRSILVVDDDVDASRLAKMILEKTGLYTVSICNRGSEAFQVIRETRPELLLLDIMMPDADGTDIADRIRKDRSLALTQVIFMTSLVSQEEVRADSVIGGRPFISKPISSENLLKQVKGFFEIEN
ncbi:MAG: response regulator [Candidatus Omnitrophica bacterium]|nr:response regulator [Candidatus Omnitrophota bacterium]